MASIDARSLDQDALIEADIGIVGAGAAGITLARELMGTPLKVAVLESGDFKFRHPPQCLYMGRNSGLESFSLARSRFRMFGGAAARWAAQCAPLEPIDFQQRDWIPHSGWPFQRAELDPFYRRAEEICRIGPYQNDISTWEEEGKRALHADGGGIRSRIFQFGYPRDFGEIYRPELQGAENVHLVLNANAVEIELNENGGTVMGLRGATLTGKRFRMVAKRYVLATGGIENPRLLLASNGVEVNGVGNRNDLVGRFFMDHPYFFSGHFEPAGPAQERNLHVVEDYDRVGCEQRVVALFALSEEVMRKERLSNCGAFFIRRPRYKTAPAYFSPAGRSFIHVVDVLKHDELPDWRFGGHLRRTVSHPRSVGALVAAQLAHRFRPQMQQALRVQLEPTPNPQSRVTLGTKKDRLGMNRVEVDWRLNADDKRSLHRFHGLLASILKTGGLGELVPDLSEYGGDWPSCMVGGKHHMGTTRMHEDPRQGVVDPDGRVHGISNLYVSGSSVFPTSGYANPTFTIVALALRLVDHLRGQFQNPDHLDLRTG